MVCRMVFLLDASKALVSAASTFLQRASSKDALKAIESKAFAMDEPMIWMMASSKYELTAFVSRAAMVW